MQRKLEDFPVADSETEVETHLITYFVNGESEETCDHVRTVRAILADAGFTPAETYQLERDSDHHIFTSYSDEVHLHNEERFTALYKGVTPTS
jgi:hypothetical protein